jgi:glycosyltransferase involved in cell wall biosynthesis
VIAQKPIRIAFVDQCAELGGAELLLLRLLKALPAEMIHPVVIVGGDGPFTQRCRAMKLETIVLTMEFRSFSKVRGGKKIIRLGSIPANVSSVIRWAIDIGRILRSEKIDILHTNSAVAHIAGGCAARLAGSRCVWHMHDLIESKRAYGAFGALWRFAAWALADSVVGVSKAVTQKIAPHRDCRTIYAGYQDSAIPSEGKLTLGIPEDAKSVGFFGRIAFVKGIDILAQAAGVVVKRDPSVHFVIVGSRGDVNDEWNVEVERILKSNCVQDHWHWLGFREDACSLMHGVDIVVLPSRREAFPLVLLEAAMAERAVVASNVGGVPEAVIDGETGVLVPPESQVALGDAILDILSRPAKATEMGRKARERIERNFPPEEFRDRFLALYASLGARSTSTKMYEGRE